MESLGSSSAQLRKLLQNDTLRARVEERMAAACDTVDAGDEKMFRLSIDKLAKELLAKAERLVANGIPASMEEKFVRKALERPVMSIKREETTELAALRSEAQALRSLSDNITRKHGMEDDEAAAMRAEKKRKKDEEETKKKNQSRGVKQLAKADTSGMKKLSSFFTKAPVKK
ncbi:putative ribonuclease h2 subunit b [Diplodia seriata]|uniref:Putative ribonuclease h2 subunit b n=1 Tax=Diplodia seriata TaxID=420778 RepID=A0A0G2GM33_9PEZI|nr:putative ribonuclease h2 subunit b [Diplodia seriata]